MATDGQGSDIVDSEREENTECHPLFCGKRIPLQQQTRECEARWAQDICDAAAKSKHPIELLLAGDICAQGYGRPKDITAAVEWWKQAQAGTVDDPAHKWALAAAAKRLSEHG
eukprot:m.239535 g.239535  ORF g.239535 m.239535 type:complete len:113 (+) comp15817_c0_seq18:103-441(+)